MNEVSMQKRLDMRKRPNEQPAMHQSWKDLIFMHWKYDAKAIQNKLPPGLWVDTFENQAYLSLIVFAMEDIRVPMIPFALPNLLEVNFRTYVYNSKGIPGIWFFSLDLNSHMGVNAARSNFFLPYHYAELQLDDANSHIHVRGERKQNPPVRLNFAYAKSNPPYALAEPGSLDFFLLERYALFSSDGKRLYMGQVHHQPYPMAQGDVLSYSHDLISANGFKISQNADLVHYSSRVDVDIFNLK
jgi:uncharacterized protein YqjF (DUF2071 family)